MESENKEVKTPQQLETSQKLLINLTPEEIQKSMAGAITEATNQALKPVIEEIERLTGVNSAKKAEEKEWHKAMQDYINEKQQPDNRFKGRSLDKPNHPVISQTHQNSIDTAEMTEPIKEYFELKKKFEGRKI